MWFARIAAVACLLLLDRARAESPTRLGTVELANSCSGAVQESLTSALAMLHSFGYDAARARFEAVIERDPECAIARWGVAMTYWHPLWEPRGPDRALLDDGKAAIQKARAIEDATRLERDLIAALDKFYSGVDKLDHLDRVLAYETAMKRVFERHPKQTEARVFYALSLLGSATSLPTDKAYVRQRKAGALLERVLENEPDHPGAAHYLIHAYDYPELAPKALAAARRYAAIAPDSPHALHMPSHIFTRLGYWDDSIASNRKVIAVAREQDIVGEQLHGTDYLVFALLQKGDDRAARAAIDDMPAPKPGGMLYFAGVYAHAAIPARYALERRQWAEAASLEKPEYLPGSRYAWADAVTHFARALGAARTGKLDNARTEVDALAKIHRDLKELREDYWATQVEVQWRAASAWLALAEGEHDRALASMRQAAKLEDATAKHPVTPGWIVPAHDLLGQMLLELRRPNQAAREFAKVLAAEPNRFGALWGAARAAELAGDDNRARARYAELVELAGDSERPEIQHARRVIAEAGASAR